jgi:hypothetical protein
LANQEFFRLKAAFDTKETGKTYPAVDCPVDYNFKTQNSVHNFRANTYPDFEPDIRFILNKGAKLCDILKQVTIPGNGLLISQRAKSIFEQFKLIPHVFFEGTVEVNGVKHTYYWMHLVWPEGINFLDFSKSKFKIKRFSRVLGEVSVNSITEMYEKQNELEFGTLVVNYESVFTLIEYDLFTHPLNGTIYISNKLKLAISKLTGAEIIPASDLEVIQTQI